MVEGFKRAAVKLTGKVHRCMKSQRGPIRSVSRLGPCSVGTKNLDTLYKYSYIITLRDQCVAKVMLSNLVNWIV
jgi:hypothetical protein